MNGTPSTANPSNSSLLRLVRLLRSGGNPLTRGVDRLEAVTLVVVVLAGLLLLPFMLMVGSETYVDISATGQEEARTHHEAVATLLEDAPEEAVDAQGVSVKSPVRATWQMPGGTSYTGTVQVPGGLVAGAQVDIWTDQEGRVVAPPVNAADAAWVAAMVAVSGWLSAVGLLAITQYCLHHLLDRRRYRAWGQEWESVSRNWDNPAGETDAGRR